MQIMKTSLHGAIFLLSFSQQIQKFFAEETREAALVDFFNMQRESSNEEGLKIYNDTEKMNEAIKKARNEFPENSIFTLNHALAAYKKV